MNEAYKFRIYPNSEQKTINYVLKSVTVRQTLSGKYYVGILFSYKIKVKKTEPPKFFSLDFSMHEFYIDSNGNCPQFPKYYRLSEKKLRGEQRKLLKCRKAQTIEISRGLELQDFKKKWQINEKTW